MSGYMLHSEAFGDIDEIRAYIPEDDLDAADRVVTAIFDRINTVVQFPHKAIAVPISRQRPLRFAVVYEYAIAYAPDNSPLRVLAVFYGRRSLRVIAAILRGRE